MPTPDRARATGALKKKGSAPRAAERVEAARAYVRDEVVSDSLQKADGAQTPGPGQQRKGPSDGPEACDDQVVDYTLLPKEMDRRFEELDTDSSLRPTIISVGEIWKKVEKRSMLAGPVTVTLSSKEQKQEREKAYDLLDALTNSGALSIDNANLHVVLAATHCFGKDIIETVIQDNTNPISKVERSNLILASTIHRCVSAKLVQGSELQRLSATLPALFDG